MLVKKWVNSDLVTNFPSCSSLREILAQINKSVWKDGAVICEIRMNGDFLSEEDEVLCGCKSVGEIESLEITTQSTQELIKSSVRSYKEFIPQIKKAALDCSEDFRELKFKEGQLLFTDVLDGCRWMTDALFLLKNSMKQYDGFMELGPSWETLENEYSAVVNQLVQAYESNDAQLLADILEYELSNSLDGWVGVFEEIEANIIKI